jgi:putative ABC transport system permease protein
MVNLVSLNEIMMSLEIGLIYGIIAIGVYLTFRVINFPDLTCDGSFVLGSAASSMLIKAGYNPFFSLFIALVSGGIAGIFTGILNSYCKVVNVLSGILVAFILYSINLRVMNGTPNITLIGVNTIFTDINPLLILSIICLIICGLWNCLLISDFGLAIRIIGHNKRLAQNGGVNVKIVTIIALALSNGFIALGGAIVSQHQGFADVGSGVGTIIIGLTSVMIGERILPYKSLLIQLISCLIGSILYRILISFALHSEVLGLETQDLNLLTGVMVIVIMMLPKVRLC